MNPIVDTLNAEHRYHASTDLDDLLAPYRPYSRDWLDRLRRGEIDFGPPVRLTASMASSRIGRAGKTDLRCV